MNNTVVVLVPMYNAQKTIKRAIDSLLKQTYPNFLAVIINDGSTDGSLECVRSLNLDHRFKIINLQENSGVGKALSEGINFAKGVVKDNFYISRLDADDEYEQDFLNKRVKILNENSEICMLYGGIKAVNGSSYVPCAIEKNKMIHISETSQGATIFIRSEAYFKAGGYQDIRYGEDYDLFEKVLKMECTSLKLDFEDYYYYRNNPQSLTATKSV